MQDLFASRSVFRIFFLFFFKSPNLPSPRLRVVPARVKITPRKKGETWWGERKMQRLVFLALADFHARSRFACFTIPEGKWGLLVVYPSPSSKILSAVHGVVKFLSSFLQ